MKNIIDHFSAELEPVLEYYKHELKALRTGRANAAMVEDIPVIAYDAKMDIKGVATITIPDSKTIMVDPWDKTLLKDVEKAIQASSLGVMPVIDGTAIRLSIPSMTEESRLDLVKIVKKKAEETLVTIRTAREKVRDYIQKQEKEKVLSEDDRFRLDGMVEAKVKESNEQVRAMALTKEEEVMTI